LIILVIFIVLAGIAIIGGTVFRVKKIDIVFTNTTTLDREAAERLLQNKLGKDLLGKNILFNLDKTKITEIVENTEIFLKVTNVKAEFPNRIVVNVRERYPVFLYKDSADTFVMDAEMRILYKNNFTGDESGLTDISFVGSGTGGLLQGTLNRGDYVMGNNDSSKEKIELINFIPRFFMGLGGYEAATTHQIRGVKFEPPVEGVIAMRIEVKPEKHETEDVHLVIMKAPGEDFAELFALVWAVMTRPASYEGGGISGFKQASQAGVYVVYYQKNEMEVVWYSVAGEDNNDDGFPDDIVPTAKFVTPPPNGEQE
jgi:hypothetical protein